MQINILSVLMKYAPLMVGTILLMALATTAQGQELIPPSPGKSTVYFVRSLGSGALVNFKYFDGERYLGKFNGRGYLIYETDPGDHVFWVTSENRDFVEATLLPDKIYIIEVRPTVGAFKAALKLFPLANDDPKHRKRIFKLISKMTPQWLGREDVTAEEKDLEFYIQNGIKKYNSDKEKGKHITHLPSSYYF